MHQLPQVRRQRKTTIAKAYNGYMFRKIHVFKTHLPPPNPSHDVPVKRFFLISKARNQLRDREEM